MFRKNKNKELKRKNRYSSNYAEHTKNFQLSHINEWGESWNLHSLVTLQRESISRIIYYDKSLTPSETKQPDFKVSTEYYSVENKTKWTAGDDTNYFYGLKEQK